MTPDSLQPEQLTSKHRFKLISWGLDECERCGQGWWRQIHILNPAHVSPVVTKLQQAQATIDALTRRLALAQAVVEAAKEWERWDDIETWERTEENHRAVIAAQGVLLTTLAALRESETE